MGGYKQEMTQEANADFENSLGKKIKNLRVNMGWSLKELGARVNLSPAYLSLLERGLTSVNVTTLQSIAKAFSVDAGDFLQPPKSLRGNITRSYDREVCYSDGAGYVCLSLAGDLGEEGKLEPIVAIIPPEKSRDEVQLISHDGEEFVLVLEGTVRLILGNKEYELNPGDSYHILSRTPHYVGNLTNRMCQVLIVSTPAKLPNSSKSGHNGFDIRRKNFENQKNTS
jgi:transcriptional regulator with XRE-family HTH domain